MWLRHSHAFGQPLWVHLCRVPAATCPVALRLAQPLPDSRSWGLSPEQHLPREGMGIQCHPWLYRPRTSTWWERPPLAQPPGQPHLPTLSTQVLNWEGRHYLLEGRGCPSVRSDDTGCPCHPCRYLIGEEGYCLTSLQSALSYVELLPRDGLAK